MTVYWVAESRELDEWEVDDCTWAVNVKEGTGKMCSCDQNSMVSLQNIDLCS